jgi:hypothetical protein
MNATAQKKTEAARGRERGNRGRGKRNTGAKGTRSGGGDEAEAAV